MCGCTFESVLILLIITPKIYGAILATDQFEFWVLQFLYLFGCLFFCLTVSFESDCRVSVRVKSHIEFRKAIENVCHSQYKWGTFILPLFLGICCCFFSFLSLMIENCTIEIVFCFCEHKMVNEHECLNECVRIGSLGVRVLYWRKYLLIMILAKLNCEKKGKRSLIQTSFPLFYLKQIFLPSMPTPTCTHLLKILSIVIYFQSVTILFHLVQFLLFRLNFLICFVSIHSLIR